MRARRGFVVTLTLLTMTFLAPCAAWGDEAVAARLAAPVEFDPPYFVAGQGVAMYARLDAGTSSWRAETLSSGLPGGQDGDPRILSASLLERSGAPLLVVRFVAWRPGQGSLPSMNVGGLVTPPLKYSCSSALAEAGTEPPQPIGQLDPPGLFARLYLIGGLALVSAIVSVIGAARFVPWLRLLKARKAFARVRRDYDELLSRLGRGKGSAAAWAELCAGLRLFLSRRTGLDWLALTSVEAARLPPDCVPGEVQPAAAAILSMGDEARFAGRLDIDLGEALMNARSVGDRLDAALEPKPARKESA
jgi:hypothetical protein